MNKSLIIILLFIAGNLWSHEGHLEGQPDSWLQWFGSFHLILLHFPIALITMTAVSEALFIWRQNLLYDYSARFMLIAAAFLATPTAILGLIYSYTGTYEGLLADFVWWHMWLGIATALLVIFVSFLREKYGSSKVYYTFLAILVILVSATSYLGGGMVFGPFHMVPPF